MSCSTTAQHVCLPQCYVPCVLQMTGLPNHDVVFVRFQNEAISNQCLPYFIAIDEHSNSVGETFPTTTLLQAYKSKLCTSMGEPCLLPLINTVTLLVGKTPLFQTVLWFWFTAASTIQ